VDSRPLHDVEISDRQERKLRSRLVAAALAQLAPREREILFRRRLKEEPDTLHDLGREYGVSYERIRQIEEKALTKIRKAVGTALDAVTPAAAPA
jgi:RNA polymerase sigma-32 factor